MQFMHQGQSKPINKGTAGLKVALCLLLMLIASTGFFFFIWKHNWNASTCALLLEISTVAMMHITSNYMKGQLFVRYSTRSLRIVKILAILMTIISLVAAVGFVGLGAAKKEDFSERSEYAAAPFAFVASFWFSVLFFDCRRYEMESG